jgi:hypothetical protein
MLAVRPPILSAAVRIGLRYQVVFRQNRAITQETPTYRFSSAVARPVEKHPFEVVGNLKGNPIFTRLDRFFALIPL